MRSASTGTTRVETTTATSLPSTGKHKRVEESEVLISLGFPQDLRGSRIFLLRICKENPAGHVEWSPAYFGFRVHLRATVDEELHNAGLSGNDSGVEGRAAAPSRVSQDSPGQLIHIWRVIQ